MKGTFDGYKHVQITLISDLHVTATLLYPYCTPSEDHPEWTEYMCCFGRHLDNYFLGPELGLGDWLLGSFKDRMIALYSEARAAWTCRGIMRSRSTASVEEQAETNRRENSSAMS